MFQLSEKYNEYIQINEYKDTRSLVLVQKGKDGKEYVQWATREMGKDKKIVKSPVGLRFESEEQLKEFAEWLLEEVTKNDDIPF